MNIFLSLTFTFACIINLSAQSDSIFIRSIYNTALSNGNSYNDLRSLCKDIGARLSGSAEAEMAVYWGKKKMESYGFDTVYLQPIKVPHWERGTKEAGWIKTDKGDLIKTHLLALGGSINTDGLIEGELIEFRTMEELQHASKSAIEGKIVFLNQAMNPNDIITFKAYGGCYSIRGNGAVEASKLGAKAIIIRSLGLPSDDHPHTGSMHYEDDTPKIPAAALSTRDADALSELLKNQSASFLLEMDCKDFPDKDSYNVIGEYWGSSKKNEFITVGGHLDSWDTGEGAHDDGAGIIHSLEAVRILKELNYKPIHSIRVVFFMNEENGNKGGINYAEWLSRLKNQKQIAAIESDRGGFSPRGFHCDGTDEQLKLLQSFEKELRPYQLHIFTKGFAGVDIHPLKKTFPSIALFGLVPDSQRYFDYHHSPNDIFENVNKRELELGCAALSSLIFLLDKSL